MRNLLHSGRCSSNPNGDSFSTSFLGTSVFSASLYLQRNSLGLSSKWEGKVSFLDQRTFLIRVRLEKYRQRESEELHEDSHLSTCIVPYSSSRNEWVSLKFNSLNKASRCTDWWMVTGKQTRTSFSAGKKWVSVVVTLILDRSFGEWLQTTSECRRLSRLVTSLDRCFVNGIHVLMCRRVWSTACCYLIKVKYHRSMHWEKG